MANNTVDAVVGETRVILQDGDGTRYSDVELIQNLNDAMGQLLRTRPDAFLSFLREGFPTLAAGDNLPTDIRFRSGLIYYTTGRAELRDDSFANDSRASILLNRAIAEWKGDA